MRKSHLFLSLPIKEYGGVKYIKIGKQYFLEKENKIVTQKYIEDTLIFEIENLGFSEINEIFKNNNFKELVNNFRNKVSNIFNVNISCDNKNDTKNYINLFNLNVFYENIVNKDTKENIKYFFELGGKKKSDFRNLDLEFADTFDSPSKKYIDYLNLYLGGNIDYLYIKKFIQNINISKIDVLPLERLSNIFKKHIKFDNFYDNEINKLQKLFKYGNKIDLELVFKDSETGEVELRKLINNKKGIFYGYFKKSVDKLINIDEIKDFPVNYENFVDYLDPGESFIIFEKDSGFSGDGIMPWTKEWFEEESIRKSYIKPENLVTFQKFGTIIGLGLLEKNESPEKMEKFYNNVFENISLEHSRTSILQMGDVLSSLLRKKDYSFFNELVDNEKDIGGIFEIFVNDNKISNKGETILSLMLTVELRNGFQVFKDENGEKQIDYILLKDLLLKTLDKLEKYIPIIEQYKDVPMKTSIGMEYEVTNGIANGYKEKAGSDYKNDIEIISKNFGIDAGADAVHEIATKPTDNPYLLLLEFQLLQDLDFIDLNFKKEDYSKGSRGLHITLGGEKGVYLNENTNFIQNILIASNIGGVNAGKTVKGLNTYGAIKEKNFPSVFGNNNTNCTEFRSLSLDKAEQFERLVLSIFNMNMANQIGENKENNKKIFKLYEKLKKDILLIIDNHNNNFLSNESIEGENEELGYFVNLFNSGKPALQVIYELGIDIDYFKKLNKFKINNEEDFLEQLKNDKMNIGIFTENQVKNLFGFYNTRLKKKLFKLEENNLESYKNLGEYLKLDNEDFSRKITNKKRFKEVTLGNENYFEGIKINTDDFFKQISPVLINKLTKINNLFIKKDSTNALSMLENTKEIDGISSDVGASETMIFDKVLKLKKARKGYNIIQGASDEMITQAIQKRILEFNDEIENLLIKNKS